MIRIRLLYLLVFICALTLNLASKGSVSFAQDSETNTNPESTQYPLLQGENFGIGINHLSKINIDSSSQASKTTLPQINGPKGIIEGLVIERGSETPIHQAIIEIEGITLQNISNIQGRFRFLNVPIGELTLRIRHRRYKEQWVSIELYENQAKEVRIYLTPLKFAENFKFSPPPPPRSATEYDLSQKELHALAGLDSDAFKSLQLMPSLVQLPFERGGFFFRGGEEGRAYLLGSPLFRSFTPSNQRSLLPTFLIKHVSSTPDYGLSYGSIGGGVVQIDLIDPLKNDLKWGVNLNLFDSSLWIGGPLTPYTTVLVGMRHSTLPFLMSTLPQEQRPEERYESAHTPLTHDRDLHFSLTHRKGKHHLDHLSTVYQSDTASWMQERSYHLQLPQDLNAQTFFLLGLQSHSLWTYRNLKKQVFNRLSFAFNVEDQEQNIALNQRLNTFKFSLYLKNHSQFRITPHLWFNVGVEQWYEHLHLDQEGWRIRPPHSGWSSSNPSFFPPHQASLSALRSGLWGQFEWRYLRTHFLLGSRVNYFEDTGEVLFQPRFTLRYTPGFGTILKLGGGVYTTQLDLLTRDRVIGQNNLQQQVSFYGSGGIENRFSRTLTFHLTGFYRQHKNRLRWDPSDEIRLKTDGTGQSSGGEALLRLDLNRRSYGWLAYTYTYARLQDGPNSRQYRGDLSQDHALSLVGGYYITSALRLNAKWRYSSGLPYSPSPSQVLDSDRNDLFWNVGAINTLIFEPFHQLDLKLDYRWTLEEGQLMTYLQFQHLYGSKGAQAVHPQYGRIFNSNTPDQLLGLYTQPFWWSLGIRGQF